MSEEKQMLATDRCINLSTYFILLMDKEISEDSSWLLRMPSRAQSKMQGA